jgi:hypothetical protein
MNFMKKFTFCCAGLVLLEMMFSPVIVKANDRNITLKEREKILQTLNAIGCSTFTEAEHEIDKKRFEIDNVVCANGQIYEIYLDQNYQLIKKELND